MRGLFGSVETAGTLLGFSPSTCKGARRVALPLAGPSCLPLTSATTGAGQAPGALAPSKYLNVLPQRSSVGRGRRLCLRALPQVGHQLGQVVALRLLHPGMRSSLVSGIGGWCRRREKAQKACHVGVGCPVCFKGCNTFNSFPWEGFKFQQSRARWPPPTCFGGLAALCGPAAAIAGPQQQGEFRLQHPGRRY